MLVHEKGKNDDLSNFRPIALESVALKVFTSFLRNSIFAFSRKTTLLKLRFIKVLHQRYQEC